MSKNNDINKSKQKVAFSRSWIKLSLGLRGFTIQSFAKQHGVKPSTVGTVFTRPYPRMERLIADTLGVAPEVIWPDRYDEKGKSNRVNLWYFRKTGIWKPKLRKKNCEVKNKKIAGRSDDATG